MPEDFERHGLLTTATSIGRMTLFQVSPFPSQSMSVSLRLLLIKIRRCVARILISLTLLMVSALGSPASDSSQHAPVCLRIDLPQITSRVANSISQGNADVFRDLTLLMQDGHSQLSFVSENVLAVYFSHPPEQNDKGASATYRMDVFFINTDSGELIEHRTWSTFKRQWFNDSYDTEGRILEVRNGFLVDASAKLELYSPDLKLVKTYDLRGNASTSTGMWSVAVATGGDLIHIQPSEQTTQVRRGTVSIFTGAGETESKWLRSDSFEQTGTLSYFGGIHSASHDSIVAKRAHCLDLEQAGRPTRHLTCSSPASTGLPTFLNDAEVLSVYYTGFSVLSTNGTELWSAGSSDRGIHRALMIGNHQRSMSGSRFAISLTGYKRKAVFDSVPVAHSPLYTIIAYDEHCRQRVFSMTPTISALEGFALSPEGRTLAVLTGTTISLYTLPAVSCADESR